MVLIYKTCNRLLGIYSVRQLFVRNYLKFYFVGVLLHIAYTCTMPSAGSIGNESVPKTIINDTRNLFYKTAVSILVISNNNTFRVLFDKIASAYFIGKYIYILALEMASPGNLHCVNCIGTLSFPIVKLLTVWSQVTVFLRQDLRLTLPYYCCC